MSSKPSPPALAEFVALGRGQRETPVHWDCNARVPEELAGRLIDTLRELDNSPGWKVDIRGAEYDPLTLDEIAGHEINVTVQKPQGGRVYFLTLDGFSAALQDETIANDASEVQVLGSFNAFETARWKIEPWNGAPLAPLPENEISDQRSSVDPRRDFVRDLTSSAITKDAAQWLLVSEESEGDVWEAWSQQAAAKLILLPVSEVWSEEGQLVVALHGARKRSFIFDPTSLDPQSVLPQLMDAARWLLAETGASEIRHEMLVRRLAGLAPEASPAKVLWCPIASSLLHEALEGAKIDYRGYASTKSTEALKAMADLRKAVQEDVSRIVERAHKLSNAFIAVMAAFAAGLGVRLALLTSSDNGGGAGVAFCFVVLFVVWAGFYMQRRVSTKSLVDDLKHMRKWHRSVHSVLHRSEYRALALSPVRDAVTLFRNTASWTFKGMTIASFLFVVGFALLPLLIQAGGLGQDGDEVTVRPDLETSGRGHLAAAAQVSNHQNTASPPDSMDARAKGGDSAPGANRVDSMLQRPGGGDESSVEEVGGQNQSRTAPPAMGDSGDMSTEPREATPPPVGSPATPADVSQGTPEISAPGDQRGVVSPDASVGPR